SSTFNIFKQFLYFQYLKLKTFTVIIYFSSFFFLVNKPPNPSAVNNAPIFEKPLNIDPAFGNIPLVSSKSSASFSARWISDSIASSSDSDALIEVNSDVDNDSEGASEIDSDSVTDVLVDGNSDELTDAESEALVDADSDALTDADSDALTDADSDTLVDAEADSDALTDPDSDSVTDVLVDGNSD